MATDFGRSVLETRDDPSPPVQDVPIEGGPNAPFDPELYEQKLAESQGRPVEPEVARSLFGPESDTSLLFSEEGMQPAASEGYAQTRADLDTFIANGDPNVAQSALIEYRAGADTTSNFLKDELAKRYNETTVDRGALELLKPDMSPEEQVAIVEAEYGRFNTKQEKLEVLVAMELMRAGHGDAPSGAIQDVVQMMSMNPGQTEALFNQWENKLNKEASDAVDRMAALQGEGFSVATGVGDIIMQDIFPFVGASTRVLGTLEFVPEDMDIATWRKGLPGEVRQKIREWWVSPNTTDEMRREYLSDLENTLKDIRKGENAVTYTQYLMIENLMGVFTPQLLEEGDPKDTWDRVAGNLDTTVGALIAVGLIVKQGSALRRVFGATRASRLTHVAEATGRRDLVENIHDHFSAVSEKYGVAPAEAASVHLPRPRADDESIEVLTDSVKEAHQANRRIADEVYRSTNDVTGVGLTRADKEDAVLRTIEDMSAADNAHPMHKMLEYSDLDDGTGLRVSVYLGRGPNKGWNDMGEMLETLRDIDPDNLESFSIWKRGKDNKTEQVDITPSELRNYYQHGIIPHQMELLLDRSSSASRLFGGRKLSTVGQPELQGMLRHVAEGGDDYNVILLELRRRARDPDATDMLTALDGQEFFIKRTQDRYWMPDDAKGYGSWANTWIPTNLRFLLAPNSKMAQIYQATRRAYALESQANEKMSLLFKPFHQLSVKSQQKVQNVLLWGEAQAKADIEKFGKGYAPNMHELITEFPDLTEAELKAIDAVREGMDVQHRMFNRRLYREWRSKGFVTARSRADGGGPNIHGQRIEAPVGGNYYNPHTRELEAFTRKEIEEILLDGGSFLKLDQHLDIPSGGQVNRVVVRKGEYEVGPLSRSPLAYYEGYTMRMYSDPVVIKKVTRNPTVNGVVRNGETHEEVIRMAGSEPAARRYLDRKGNKVKNAQGEYVSKDPDTTFRIELARDINTVEGVLAQAETLAKDGRMFWDTRAMQRLPDINENPAQVWDLGHTLNKGTQMALRQVTQEDLFRTFKQAFMEEFGDLPDLGKMSFEIEDLGQMRGRLQKGLRNASDPSLKDRYRKGLRFINYMRSQLGTDAFGVPVIRQKMIALANWIGKAGPITDKPVSFLQRIGLSADPFATLRRQAFYNFMTLRPVRQLALQGAQISMMFGLAPTYIGSFKIVLDGLALRRGVTKLRKSGYDDGWKDSKIAGIMGLSKREYRRLVEEFDSSGMLGTVDTHAHNAAGATQNIAKMDADAGAIGRGVYSARRRGRQVLNVLNQGFEQGEMANLTFSYLLAARRMKKATGKKSFLKFTKQEWEQTALDADSLALAMTRPNKMAYQQGMPGVALQFMSFQHRALLTMLGQNPAIKPKELWRMYAGMYTLWGFNMFGAEDYVRDFLGNYGIDGTVEVYNGASLQDILSAGFIETGYNMLARAYNGTELEFESLAPGANVYESFVKNMYEAFTEKPITDIVFGPSKSVIDSYSAGFRFIESNWDAEAYTPQEKLIALADIMGQEGFAVLNDQMKVWRSYQLQQFVDKANDPLPIQATVDGLVARGLLGIRPESEMAFYELKREIWENEDNITNMVDAIQRELKVLAIADREKRYSKEWIWKRAAYVWAIIEDAPEGAKQEIFERVFNDLDFEGEILVDIISQTAREGTMNLRELIPWVQKVDKLDPEGKKTIIDFINNVEDQKEKADMDFDAMMHNDLEGLKDGE